MRIPGKLTGTHDLVSWLNSWRDATLAWRLVSGPGYRVKESTNGVVLDIFGVGGGGSLSILLYDPAKACSAGKIYKVRTTDAAAVTGIEISAGVFVTATPGKFYCLKSTPANPTAAKHIPSLPDGSGQTDPAHADKHFEFITPATVCTGGTAVEV